MSLYRLYKTIDADNELIKDIKNRENSKWKIVFENDIYVDIEKIKENI